MTFTSVASNLVPGDTNNRYDVFVHDRRTHTTTRASVSSTGTQANGYSPNSTISANGRYVSFTSGASNLIPDDTNNATDIFVRDQWTGTTTRISVSSTGTQTNNDSHIATISANGRYVTFESDASNLIPDDTNNATDIFVHDRGC